MLSRLTIPIRVLLLLMVPLAVLLIVGLGGLASINAGIETTKELQQQLERQIYLETMRDEARTGLLQAIEAVLAKSEDPAEALTKLQAVREKVEKSLAGYIESIPADARPQAEERLQPAVTLTNAVFKQIETVLANVGEFDGESLAYLLSSSAMLNVSEATARVDAILAEERAKQNRVLGDVRARGQSFFKLNAILGFAGLAVALFFGYYIGRSITDPVHRITETVRYVAGGDLEARTRLTGYDELTELSIALDQLLDEKVATLARAERDNAQLNDSVIQLLRAVSRLSQRDLTVRVPVTEDVTGPVADAINQLATETARVLADVSRVADQVASASAQVKHKAESVNAVAHDQRTEALDTAAKLSQASQRLSDISQLAQQCNELAQRAAQNTESAVATVTGTLQGMTDIREVIQETGKRIKRLGERSQEISGIVDIINKIAERTTVLALNASMQAAAAGDAGRGFGVVADEVQRLAESTRNAAGQIGTLIKSIQVETNDTIGTMENAIGQVVQGSKMAEVAGKQIGETQGATQALVQSVRQIAASSQEQAQLSETLRDRAQAMMSGVRATGEHVAEQLQETHHLTDFAQRLLESVRVFKLPDATQAR